MAELSKIKIEHESNNVRENNNHRIEIIEDAIKHQQSEDPNINTNDKLFNFKNTQDAQTHDKATTTTTNSEKADKVWHRINKK